MVDVIGVRFRESGKVYYFDPVDFDLTMEEKVIVETARGLEFGVIAMDRKSVKSCDVVQPLKKVVRIANEEDLRKHDENNKKRKHALELCQEKIDDHQLDMKLIDVEYTFDNNKIIFYFTADGRVDFRELVKDLAGVFRMRIELRQIGVRDEAKMLGGIGNCGRGLCCHEWLSDFHPVSIKMAKVQNLSLNPSKISGICGRLMCCLKYENDIYFEMKKDLPDPGERVMIAEGKAVVADVNILEGKVKCRLIEKDDESENGEKLSTEYYIYGKDDIERIERSRKSRNRKRDDQDDDIPDEVKKLLD